MLPKAILDQFTAREKLGKEAEGTITSLKEIPNSVLAK